MTSRSILKCVCGKIFTIKSAPGHYRNSCTTENSPEVIEEYNRDAYERVKTYRGKILQR